VVDLCSLSYSIGTIVTFCYVCVCVKVTLFMCFEGGLLFVRPNVPLSSPSAIVKGLGASFLVNA
jgi:hypothetical protein